MYLGPCYILSAVVYTIPKTGSSHAHIVLWFAERNKLITPQDLDEVISAEISDGEVDPAGYKASLSL